MSFINKIKNELEAQVAARELCYGALEKMPQGRLVTKCRSNSNPEHYLRLSASVPLQYLGSNDKNLIKQLQQKREFENQLKALNNNIPLLERVISKYISIDSVFSDIHSGPQVHASQNHYKQEELIYLTSAGIYVRSKGEAIIIDVLWQRRIPFYYEKKLILFDENGQKVVVYPDITILLSQRELLLWEHNGMLSNEEYRRRNNRKMELYFLNGFYQPKNLIVTADGPNGEFSIPDIYRIVDGLIRPRL